MLTWLGISSAVGIGGFVIGWLWGTRTGSLESVRWLDVLTALGTVSTAVVAVLLGVYGDRQRKQEQLKGSHYYTLSLVDTLIYIHGRLNRLQKTLKADPSQREFVVEEFKQIRQQFSGLDVEKIGSAFPRVASILSASRMFVVQASLLSGDLPGTASTCYQNIQQAKGNLQGAWNAVLGADAVRFDDV